MPSSLLSVVARPRSMARSPGTSLTMPRTAASARCSHHNRDRRHSNAHTQPVVQRLRGLAYLPIRGRPTGGGRRRHRGSNRCVSAVGCGWLVLQQVAELLTQFPVSQKHARHVAPSLRPACCLVQQGMIRYVSTHTTGCAKVGVWQHMPWSCPGLPIHHAEIPATAPAASPPFVP